MSDNKAALEGKFERWFYTARDPVKDMPYGTHLLYRVCDNDKDKFEIGCELLMAAFVGGHEAALAATQPREPEPEACPACKGEPESGFIEMDNNGPIVPCRTCNSDPESCADVPSLRHCEAANRETATHPPQATDAQRRAAMRTFDDGFDSYETREYADNGPDTGKAEGQLYFFWPEQVQQIKAALQSPAVPRKLVEKAKERLDQINIEMRSIGHASPTAVSEIRVVLDALLGGKESQ